MAASPNPSQPGKRAAGRIRRVRLAAGLLLLATFAVYGQVQRHDFVDYDDPAFVTQNDLVRAGWSWPAAARTFRWDVGYWHPLTWLSLMLDAELYGVSPAGFHRTNLFLHVGAVLALFFSLHFMTGSLGRSLFVAALYAVHPLHVESVAWISERKGLLANLFWMLALSAYARFAAAPSRWRLFWPFLCFLLALLAKPGMVMLPVVLVLLDYWPLRRGSQLSASGSAEPPASVGSRWLAGRLREKVPYFALAAVFACIAVTTQQCQGALRLHATLPLSERLTNAAVTPLVYLQQAFWPTGFSAFYPHPRNSLTPPEGLAALLVLLAVTVCVWLLRARAPVLTVGWFWFLLTLLPTLGLVQVGAHARADRYTDMPLVGIELLVGWGIPSLVPATQATRRLFAAGGLGIVLVLMGLSWRQTAVWKDSRTLYAHMLRVSPSNYVAHANLALVLMRDGETALALQHAEAAVRLRPEEAQTHATLGAVLSEQGRLEEAVPHLARAAQFAPRDPRSHFNLGLVLARLGRWDAALQACEQALAIDPGYAKAAQTEALIYQAQGRTTDAARLYQRFPPE